MNSVKLQKYRRFLGAPLLALFLLVLSPAPAKAAELEMRVGEHGSHSRIVFDWNRMVGYAIDRQGDRLTVTFNTGASEPFRVPSAHRLQQIRDIRVAEQGQNRTVIEIDLASNAAVRDFRLVRRIIFDISEGSAPPRETPTATAPPIPTAPPATREEAAADEPEETVETEPMTEETVRQAIESQISTDRQQTPAETAEPEQTEPAPSTAPEPEQVTEMPDPPVVEDAPQAGDPVEQRPTIITIGLLEPAGLAVFERFGSLWVVLESRRGSVAPERFGPLAETLGPPRMLELEGGGVAYRFQHPEDQHIAVRKEPLAWQVVLTTDPHPAFVGARIEQESSNGEQKLVGYFNEINRMFTVADPATGEELRIVPSRAPSQVLREPLRTPDLEILQTYLGFVALARKDGVEFELENNKITMSAAGGLTLSTPESRRRIIDPFENQQSATSEGEEESRLFNFKAWRNGGLQNFSENRYELIGALARMENPNDRTNALFQLALLYFSNGFGDEALGIFDLIAEENEDLAKRSSYLAIRGAANALAGRYEEALDDLGTPALQTHPEARLWRGYAAASAEQWRLAERLFPDNIRLLDDYPEKLAIPLTLYMAESALRNADSARAATFLEALDVLGDDLPVRYQAAQHYLRGEMYRQNNQPDKALAEWDEAVEYRDRLYQTKSRLAKTLLEWQSEMITAEDALETLEHMRFAWRDDGLETQILHSIGLLRVVNNKYYDGMVQLQNAIRLAKGSREDTEPLTNDLVRIFRELFVDGKARDIPQMEAITIYNSFQELMPSGADGVKAVLTMADFYVDMDLLDRAATGLEDLLDNRSVQGEDASSVGARLAVIYLLDDKPNDAISALQRTSRSGLPEALGEERQLLRARALSQLDMTEEAIEALDDLRSRNAQRLRADIYWRAADWQQAADAFSRILPRPDIDEITTEEAEFILNTAVALKLAGDENRLRSFKADYDRLMQATALAPSFNVVTREAGVTTLSDRETMLNIAEETDIFRGFLDSYRASDAISPDEEE